MEAKKTATANSKLLKMLITRYLNELSKKNLVQNAKGYFYEFRLNKEYEVRKVTPKFENDIFVYYKFCSIHFLFKKGNDVLVPVFAADDRGLTDSTERKFLFKEGCPNFVISHVKTLPEANKFCSLYSISFSADGNENYTVNRTERPYRGDFKLPEVQDSNDRWVICKEATERDVRKKISAVI